MLSPSILLCARSHVPLFESVDPCVLHPSLTILVRYSLAVFYKVSYLPTHILNVEDLVPLYQGYMTRIDTCLYQPFLVLGQVVVTPPMQSFLAAKCSRDLRVSLDTVNPELEKTGQDCGAEAYGG